MFDHLFSPIDVGKMHVPNRLWTAPTAFTSCDSRGFATERTYESYVERARGGWGLVCVEASFVRDDGYCYQGFMGASQIGHFSMLGEIADAIHEQGAKAAIQPVHGGRGAMWRHTGFQPVAPSNTTPDWPPDGSNKCRGLTLAECEEVIDCFANSAARAKAARFDAVLLHGAHNFLIGQFQSRYTNHRTDKYKPETGFTVELIKRVRAAVGPDFTVGLRISGDEHIGPKGITIEQNVRMMPEFVAAGLDYIEINAGSRETRSWVIPPLYRPHACNLDVAVALKKAVNVPIVLAGRINDPAIAEQIIASGKADAVAMGRGAIADPSLARKAREGRLEDIRRCVACNTCTQSLTKALPCKCALNYEMGRFRWEAEIKTAAVPKKVLIIGGGPGGMEAARIAAMRGHKVTLWEKSGALGGNLIPGSVPDFKVDYRAYLAYLATQVKKTGVNVELNKEATLDKVKQWKPDAVVVATGSTPIIPDIPGVKKKNVVTAVDALMEHGQVGDTVIVRGGGLVASDTALHLAQKGKKVTMVTGMPNIAPDLAPADLACLMELMTKYNVKILTGTKTLEFTDKGLLIDDKDGNKTTVEGDTLVVAVGFTSNNKLFESLKKELPNVYAIGDCVEPRLVASAVWDGARIAREI